MNIELTDENLEYIAFVARQYCNIYDDCYGDLAVATALHHFKNRITQIEDPEKLFLYTNTDELQASIKKYNLNPDKFWLLILFLKDFTNSCFGATNIYDEISVGENVEKILKMLDSPFRDDCELTISNGKESATINAVFIEKLVLNRSIEELKSIYPMVKVSKNNKPYHKIKFFMELLDYFLNQYDATYTTTNDGTKDWGFTAKILYLANLVDEHKYFSGYEDIVTKKGNTIRNKAYYIGKELKNSTKTLRDTSDRHKSDYCYIPEPE